MKAIIAVILAILSSHSLAMSNQSEIVEKKVKPFISSKSTKVMDIAPAEVKPVETEEVADVVTTAEEVTAEIQQEEIYTDVETGEAMEAPACELEEQSMQFLGAYTITYYCPCESCNGEWSGTASGEALTPGYTVAMSDVPLGTTVYIEGIGYRCVADCGVGSGVVDVLVGSHEEALALGMTTANVYVVG